MLHFFSINDGNDDKYIDRSNQTTSGLKGRGLFLMLTAKIMDCSQIVWDVIGLPIKMVVFR